MCSNDYARKTSGNQIFNLIIADLKVISYKDSTQISDEIDVDHMFETKGLMQNSSTINYITVDLQKVWKCQWIQHLPRKTEKNHKMNKTGL